MTTVHFLNDGTRTKAFIVSGTTATIETTEYGKPLTAQTLPIAKARQAYRLGLDLGWTEGCATHRLTTEAAIDAYIARTVDMDSDNGPEEALAIEENAFAALRENGFYEVAI